MGVRNALTGGAAAGIGLLALIITLAVVVIQLAFYVGLLVVVFGGAYLILDHLGVLMVAL